MSDIEKYDTIFENEKFRLMRKNAKMVLYNFTLDDFGNKCWAEMVTFYDIAPIGELVLAILGEKPSK